jgi:hypothetical protein
MRRGESARSPALPSTVREHDQVVSRCAARNGRRPRSRGDERGRGADFHPPRRSRALRGEGLIRKLALTTGGMSELLGCALQWPAEGDLPSGCHFGTTRDHGEASAPLRDRVCPVIADDHSGAPPVGPAPRHEVQIGQADLTAEHRGSRRPRLPPRPRSRSTLPTRSRRTRSPALGRVVAACAPPGVPLLTWKGVRWCERTRRGWRRPRPAG